MRALRFRQRRGLSLATVQSRGTYSNLQGHGSMFGAGVALWGVCGPSALGIVNFGCAQGYAVPIVDQLDLKKLYAGLMMGWVLLAHAGLQLITFDRCV